MLGIEIDPKIHCEVLSNTEFFKTAQPITADMIIRLKSNIKMPAFGDRSLVKRLLKLKSQQDFPLERVDQLKFEVKLMKEYFGDTSAEKLKSNIRLIKHLTDVGRLDEALQLVNDNLTQLPAMNRCNALLPTRLYLHLAEIQFKKEDMVNALFNICRALRLVSLSIKVTMSAVDHNASMDFSFHPVFVAVLHYVMFIAHQSDTLPLFLTWLYIMYGVEKMFPFPGTSQEFQ